MKWEEPRPSTRAQGGYKWREEAEALRSNPREWALLAERDSRSRAYDLSVNVKQGRIAAFRPYGSFEATVRREDGVHKVYARYVGTSDAAT